MSARRCSLVAAAAGGFLAVTVPVAHADGDSSDALGLAGAIDPSFVTSMTDPGFISSTENFGRFTDIAAANPDDSHFVANVFEGPLIHGTPLFEDILTSGADPGNGLAALGVPGELGMGVAGETINTFLVPSDPLLDFTTTLPFADPLAGLFTELIQIGLI